MSRKYSQAECERLWEIYEQLKEMGANENRTTEEWKEMLAARFNFGLPEHLKRTKNSLRRKLWQLRQEKFVIQI